MGTSFNAKSTAEQVLRGINLTGKTVLLTGCNSGLGFETMRVLTGHGAHVLAAARTLQSAKDACARISGQATPIACDLSDRASVKQAVDDILASGLEIDRVIANAGIMMLPKLERIDGLEKQFVVNYLGHFNLINGVLDAIPTHAGARIVILASEAHRFAPKAGVDLTNLSGAHGYGPAQAYGQSNVARILFARALSRRLTASGVTVNSLHPGVIGSTHLARHLNPLMALGMKLISKTVPQGAATQVYLAAHPEVAGMTGQYFADCRIAKPSSAARDDALGEQLWTVSQQWLAEPSR